MAKREYRCAMCGRKLPRVKTAKGSELDPTVPYSNWTGLRYCPPRRWKGCKPKKT
jgi:hypothetical protein